MLLMTLPCGGRIGRRATGCWEREMERWYKIAPDFVRVKLPGCGLCSGLCLRGARTLKGGLRCESASSG